MNLYTELTGVKADLGRASDRLDAAVRAAGRMSSGELQNVGQGDIVIKYYDQISLRNLATRLIDDPKKTEAVTFSGVMYAALKQLETLKQEREDLRRSLSQLGKYIDNVKEAGA